MSPQFFRPAVSEPQNSRDSRVPGVMALEGPSDVFPPPSTFLRFESDLIVKLTRAEELRAVLMPIPKMTFDV